MGWKIIYNGGIVNGGNFGFDNVDSNGIIIISGVIFNNNGAFIYKGGNGIGGSIIFINFNINYYKFNFNVNSVIFNNSVLGSMFNGSVNIVGNVYIFNVSNIIFNNLIFNGGWFVFDRVNVNVYF